MKGSCTQTHTHTRTQKNTHSFGVFGGLYDYCVTFAFSRTAWVQKIKAASEEFIETEKKKREKAYQGLSLHSLLDGNRCDDLWVNRSVCVRVRVCSSLCEG